MTLEPLSFLVLGSGRMAQRHTQALASIRATPEVIGGKMAPVRFGIYARNKDKLRVLQEETGADFASDHMEASIERSDVDVVDNCLVNRLHVDPLMHAIKSGKHVFTDKPLGMTLEETHQLRDAAVSTHVARIRVSMCIIWPKAERYRDSRFSCGLARSRALATYRSK